MALTDKLTAIGDAIREKNGSSDLIPLADMPQAILDIASGGEGGTSLPELSAEILYWNSLCFYDEKINNVNRGFYPVGSSPLIDSKNGWDLSASSYSKYIEIKPNEQINNISVGCWLKWKGSNGNYQRIISIYANNKSGWYCPLFLGTSYMHDSLQGFSAQEIVKPDLSDGEYHYFSCSVTTENGTTTIKEYWDNVLCYVITGGAIDYISHIDFSSATYWFNGCAKNLWIADGVLSEEEFITMSKVEKIDKLTELEVLIDESGVLEDTAGTATEKVEQLIEKAENENLWFDFIKNRENNSRVFIHYNATELPRVDLSNSTDISYLCSNAQKLKRVDFYIDCKNVTNAEYVFNQTYSLEFIKGFNTSSVVSMGMGFNQSGVVTIEQPFDLSSVTRNLTNCFICSKLVNVKFIAETIKISIRFSSAVLSAESIQSIIDGLAYVETAQTLNLHSAIVLTDEQKATINAKGWTLVQ